MKELFEEVQLQTGNHFCSWYFKYKGKEFTHIENKDMTTKAQIVVLEDMIKTMKRIH